MTTFGIDYAFEPHPSIADIKKAGAKFVCRYLADGHGGSKELTPAEAKAFTAAGLNIIVVWETTAGRAKEGHTAGKHDVHAALNQAGVCGMPSDRPIFFAVDFDAEGPEVAEYFRAVKETIGYRAGVYGGIRSVKYLHDHSLVGWSWQTYAWSGGKWDPRAHLQQYSNGERIGGCDVDYDRGLFADYGQWRVGWSPAKPVPTPTPPPPVPIVGPTPYQIRELQRAENSFSDRYKLNQPRVPVDSVYGPLTARESTWMQKILGIRPDQIGGWPIETVTKWLYHPSLYFATHPGGLIRHQKALAALRTSHPQTGVVGFDNVPTASWIADILTKARAAGINLRVSSGYRSYAEQKYIYDHEAGNGYPVAYPGTSHHQGINYPDGAVDVYVGQLELSRWLQSNPTVARGLVFAGSKDAVHFSVPGSHRSGEGDY